jgi:DNA-binding SARP family transcriptional activator
MDFRILGPLEVRGRDGRAIVVRGSKERALLAILLLHANRVVATDRLVDQLWGEDPPRMARKSLQVRVSSLRKSIGDVLLSRAPGYLVRVQTGELDLHRFEQLAADAREALDRNRAETASGLLREALDLWRGPPLADVQQESVLGPAVARLEELRLAAIELQIEADLACGRHAEVVAELELLTAEHPYRERFHGQLMLALYRAGRQVDALEAYRRARTRLVEELGIEPAPSLQALEQAILRHDRGLEPAAPRYAPDRSILVAALNDADLEGLLGVAEPLAARPPREIIVACVADSSGALGAAADAANSYRATLSEHGFGARVAVFTSTSPGPDVVRIAAEQDVDLLLVEAPRALLDDPVLRSVLEHAPCDVGVLRSSEPAPSAGAVFVPFVGAEHDWAAVELGAWIARAQGVPLRLAGPARGDDDASRLLASASLAVQRALGVTPDPLVIAPGGESLLSAAEDSALVVLGLPDRWRTDGMGEARLALATHAQAQVVIVRHGLRPGGLAPRESLTRYTWSIGAATDGTTEF